LKPVKEAKRHARMFIGIVGVEEAPKALEELMLVERLMEKSREFRSLLLSPGFSREEKETALVRIAERAKLSLKVLKFITYITEHKGIAAIGDIIKAATTLYLEKMKRTKAVILTPVEITKNYEDRLKVSLKKLVARDVDIEYVIDQSLLGGVLVKVGSTMYDSSIKGQLRLLKDELIKG
jgi:ATP synthase F1 delta subunit